MKGFIKRDDEGKPIADSSGFLTVTCEDDSVVFQIHLSELDEKTPQLYYNVNGKDVSVDTFPWETVENDCEIDRVEIAEDDKNVPSTSKSGNAHFPWCDASTKIFLKEYKLKRELVRNRKLKNMKLAYQEISQSLQGNGFTVTPLQVENRFKTLKRAYKNMIIHNRRNGRGKYICSYEEDLDEIFSKSILNDDIETNGDASLKLESGKSSNQLQTSFTGSSEVMHNFAKINEQYARLEAQNMKLIDNLQNSQRTIKNLINKTDNRSKICNETQNKIMQIMMEMHELQKVAYARAEEQREKASVQRDIRNNLLEEILAHLKTKKEKEDV